MTELQKYYELQKNSTKQYHQFLKKLSCKTTSRKFFSLKNGQWESIRKTLHNNIINKYLTSYSSQPTPTLYFILGSIGAGKTSLKDTVVKSLKNKNLLYINFDDLKLKLPEYKILKKLNPKKAAQFVQSESSKLAGTLYRKAIKNKINIIYEKNIRLNKEGKLHIVSEIKSAFRKGYSTSINVVFLDSWQEAWKRVKLRYEKIGRYVPKLDVKNTFNDLFPNLNTLMNENFNTEYSVKLWYNQMHTVNPAQKYEAYTIGFIRFKKEFTNKGTEMTNTILDQFQLPGTFIGHYGTTINNKPKTQFNSILHKERVHLLPRSVKKSLFKIDIFKKDEDFK